ncbi:MAG TPA: GNAT family protein [Patescibacteria group bacterium]|nr:GNAT family protein [Patescibacteria group bacterium]
MQNPEIEIRELTADDALQFGALRREALRTNPEAFGSTMEEENSGSEERFLKSLPNSGYFVMGAFKAGRLVGLCGFLQEVRLKIKHKGTIWGMFVQPDARGYGIGRQLLESSVERAFKIEEIEQILLSVVDENEAACCLYESFGFKKYGTEGRALKKDGKYWDEHLMVIFKDNF